MLFFPEFTWRRFHVRHMSTDDLSGIGGLPSVPRPQVGCAPDPAFIRYLLRSDLGFGYLVQDIASAATIAYKVTIFTTSEYARYATDWAARQQADEAFRGLTVNAKWILGPRRIAAENAELGLLAVTFGAWDHSMADARSVAGLGRILEAAVVQAHAGFNVRQFLLYACSSDHASYVAAGGASLLGGSCGLPPFLLGARREDAPRLYGRTVAKLFDYDAPLMYFSLSCRELLVCALSGLSDGQIAERLHISRPAVKKRWDAAFAAAAQCFPNWTCEAGHNGGRGPQKRTALLNYVRQHPEELKPNSRVIPAPSHR